MKDEKKKYKFIVGMYVLLVGIISFFFISSFSPLVSSGVGETVSVKTTLEVGAVYPEILNISINNDANVTLTPNATTTVMCQALIQDWNNDSDIYLVNSTLYDTAIVNWNDADNFTNHYTNSSCVIQNDTQGLFGKVEDDWHAIANCSFEVEYYANPSSWNCSIYVEDLTNRSNREENNGGINELLAVGLPDTINYGIVNSTEVSDEQDVLVENVGNVILNLTLRGYANESNKTDGHAMNCSKGGYKFIDTMYEKFNLTATTVGSLSLTEFESNYINLTSTDSPATQEFNLPVRSTDRASATKSSFWRIYVPKGLAGTCEGFIEFGAVRI